MDLKQNKNELPKYKGNLKSNDFNIGQFYGIENVLTKVTLDIDIDGKENAKMTGDRMKMLMLTLPFMVRDLIAPEVHPALHSLTLHIVYTWYIAVYWVIYLLHHDIYSYIPG